MPQYDRAIIGAGTSAAVYLCYYPQKSDEKVVVVGQQEPWARRGSHLMGQPPHLLELPMENTPHSLFAQDLGQKPSNFKAPVNPLKAPSRIPRLPSHYQPPHEDSSAPPNGPYLESNRYARTIQELLGNYKPIPARVKKITRNGGDYIIEMDNFSSITAKKVIIASGPGSARASRAYNKEYDNKPNVFVSGEAFLDESVKVTPGSVVCVEGGSATAAWAVEKALKKEAMGVFWFNRPEGTRSREERFAGAFPAGRRNDWLKKNEGKIIWCIADVESSKLANDRIEVLFKNGTRVLCDQYVAAIGASGGLSYVDKNLESTLKPIKDDKGYLDPDKQAILGLCNDDKSLLVVGPAMYEKHKQYQDSNKYLPMSARPPEGIPTIIATISALRRYLGGTESRWVEFNLQSFRDLDEYFHNAVGFFLAAGLGISAQGYTMEQIAQFVTDQVVGTRIMKSSSFGVTEDEMRKVFDQIWNFAYTHLGKKQWEEWAPMLQAYYSEKKPKK